MTLLPKPESSHMLKPFGIDRTERIEPCHLIREKLVLKDVPVPHPDLVSYEAWRLPTGEIARIEAQSKVFQNDPCCVEAQNIYFSLREILSEKYGEQPYMQEAFSRDANFWHSLITGKEQRITIWSSNSVEDHDVMFVLVSIEAHARFCSQLTLRYQFATSEATALVTNQTL